MILFTVTFLPILGFLTALRAGLLAGFFRSLPTVGALVGALEATLGDSFGWYFLGGGATGAIVEGEGVRGA